MTEDPLTVLLPLACTWAEEQEKVILHDGVTLSAVQTADAKTIGVLHPERVRLLSVSAIPVPRHPLLRSAAEATRLISSDTAGLTLRHGIFIRADHWDNRRLVFHELVHTSQYERLVGFLPFLKQYLHECLTVGYPEAPMEQEAVTMTKQLCT
jgi:hypothetical protein